MAIDRVRRAKENRTGVVFVRKRSKNADNIGKYKAFVFHDKRRITLGFYGTEDEALIAVAAGKIRYGIGIKKRKAKPLGSRAPVKPGVETWQHRFKDLRWSPEPPPRRPA